MSVQKREVLYLRRQCLGKKFPKNMCNPKKTQSGNCLTVCMYIGLELMDFSPSAIALDGQRFKKPKNITEIVCFTNVCEVTNCIMY